MAFISSHFPIWPKKSRQNFEMSWERKELLTWSENNFPPFLKAFHRSSKNQLLWKVRARVSKQQNFKFTWKHSLIHSLPYKIDISPLEIWTAQNKYQPSLSVNDYAWNHSFSQFDLSQVGWYFCCAYIRKKLRKLWRGSNQFLEFKGLFVQQH